jgi:hypothetical protein
MAQVVMLAAIDFKSETNKKGLQVDALAIRGDEGRGIAAISFGER